jgi:hypothetical protein
MARAASQSRSFAIARAGGYEMCMAFSPRLLALLGLIVCAAALRLVPHPPNFTPIGAMALFAGATLPRRAMAVAAPLLALLVSDLVLGFYAGMEVVYLSTALVVAIGWLVAARRTVVSIAAAALASSVAFFLITNFGVWLSSGMYARSASGLAACYTAALPFFQNSVAGDLFYSALLFGGFALAERLVPRLRQGSPFQPA